MILVRQKVSDKQFHDFTHRLWSEFAKITALEELIKYKMSIRHVWSQATTDDRLYRAEKITAEYRYLYCKFTKQHEEHL